MSASNQSMEKSLNEQINAEMFSAYLYLSMAAYFEAEGLDGFGNWMKVQAQEEMTHAMKFYTYILERDGRVNLKAIQGPETKWQSPMAVFEAVLGHEKKVTQLISNLVNQATEEKDHATFNFLQWFVSEQVEEEKSASQLLQKLKMMGDHGPSLYLLDKELATRTFVPPTTQA